jgi:hypothetical protein
MIRLNERVNRETVNKCGIGHVLADKLAHACLEAKDSPDMVPLLFIGRDPVGLSLDEVAARFLSDPQVLGPDCDDILGKAYTSRERDRLVTRRRHDYVAGLLMAHGINFAVNNRNKRFIVMDEMFRRFVNR